MKTINVKATNDPKTRIEKWYVIPLYTCGVILPDYDRYLSPDALIVCNVLVGNMFPGTHEEWDRHIIYCIEQKLLDEGIAYEKEGWGVILNDN